MRPIIGSTVSTSMSRAKNKVPTIAAMFPIVFITPLPCERNSAGTISGIKATTGPRTDCLNKFNKASTIISALKECCAEYGIKVNMTADKGKRTIIHGILRPIFVRVLSDNAEITGIKKIAKILSSDIKIPTSHLKGINLLKKIVT